MRTTLTINDELLREAKELAARRQSNVSTIVNEALRKELKKDSRTTNDKKFTMITYGDEEETAKDLLPEDFKEMLAAEERAPYSRI